MKTVNALAIVVLIVVSACVASPAATAPATGTATPGIPPTRYGDLVPGTWDADGNGFINLADVADKSKELAAMTAYMEQRGRCFITTPITRTPGLVHVFYCPG